MNDYPTFDKKLDCAQDWLDLQTGRKMRIFELLFTNAANNNYRAETELSECNGDFSQSGENPDEDTLHKCFKGVIHAIYVGEQPETLSQVYMMDPDKSHTLNSADFIEAVCSAYEAFWFHPLDKEMDVVSPACTTKNVKYMSTEKPDHVELEIELSVAAPHSFKAAMRVQANTNLIATGFPLQEAIIVSVTLDMEITDFDATKRNELKTFIASEYGVDIEKCEIRSVVDAADTIRRRLLATQISVTLAVYVSIRDNGLVPNKVLPEKLTNRRQNVVNFLVKKGYIKQGPTSSTSDDQDEGLNSSMIILIVVGACVGLLMLYFIIYHGFLVACIDPNGFAKIPNHQRV